MSYRIGATARVLISNTIFSPFSFSAMQSICERRQISLLTVMKRW